MNELVFEVTQEADGGFVAEALGESVITQADTWEELRNNVLEAVEAYFFDSHRPLVFVCISPGTKCWPQRHENPTRPERSPARAGLVSQLGLSPSPPSG